MEWEGIVIHHTCSHDVSIKTVRGWHKSQGWPNAGYHYLIRSNGSVEHGMNIKKQGIHARGRNHTHIGIALTGCFSGRKPNKKALIEPTDEQMESLTKLLYQLLREYNLEPQKIERHHKDCPGDRFPFKEIFAKFNHIKPEINGGGILMEVGNIEAATREIKNFIHI